MRIVGITSGASAPEELVKRLVQFFRDRGTDDVQELEVIQRGHPLHAPQGDPAGARGQRLSCRPWSSRTCTSVQVSGRAALEDPDDRAQSLREDLRRRSGWFCSGDVIELRQGPIQDALAAASRILPQLVAGLGEGREVVLLMGNHDHQLRVHSEALGQVEWMLSHNGDRRQDRVPGRLAARRRLRRSRALPRPAHDDAGLRARRRRCDGAVSEAAAVRDVADQRLRAPAGADLRLDVRDLPDQRARDRRRRRRRVGAGAEADPRVARAPRDSRCRPACARCSGVADLARLGPFSPDLSPVMLRRSSLIAYGGGARHARPAAGLRALRPHPPRRPAARRRPLRVDHPVRASSCSTPAAGSTSRRPSCPRSRRTTPTGRGFAVELDDDGPPRLVNLLDAESESPPLHRMREAKPLPATVSFPRHTH